MKLIRFNFSKELVLYDPDPRPSFDRNRNGRGVLIYICEDVTSKILENHLLNDIEGMFIQLKLTHFQPIFQLWRNQV